jgi:hypothetical protein
MLSKTTRQKVHFTTLPGAYMHLHLHHKTHTMTTTDYTTSILVDQTPPEVFRALNNVRGWWSEAIEGNTDHLNDEFDYHYQDVHRCKMRVVEFVPNKKVAWQVVDNYFSFTKDKNEWKGNTISFDISEKGDKTLLRFTQTGLVPEYECYDICENAWNTYINKSLYNLITTGKGQPNGNDKPQTADEKVLATPDFTTTFFVNQPPSEVFRAINNVRGWWQGEVEGSTDKPGDEFTYRMKDIHFSRQRVIEIIPDQKVVWLITDSNLPSFTNPAEWTGTTVSFEINEINNKTQMRFTHHGLTAGIECYDSCTNAWSMLIQESLFSLATKGKGKRVF